MLLAVLEALAADFATLSLIHGAAQALIQNVLHVYVTSGASMILELALKAFNIFI